LLRTNKNEIESDMFNFRIAIKDRVIHLRKYKKYISDQLIENDRLFKLGNKIRNIENEITWDSENNHTAINIEIKEKEREWLDLQIELDKILPIYEAALSKTQMDIYSFLDCVQVIRQFGEYLSKNRNMKDKIYFILLEADRKHLITINNHIARTTSQLVPKSFVYLIIFLVFLAITGIITPIMFLETNYKLWGSQIFLSSALVVGVIGIIGYIFYQMYEIKNLGKFVWNEDNKKLI
jgi:hypothetical protein